MVPGPGERLRDLGGRAGVARGLTGRWEGKGGVWGSSAVRSWRGLRAEGCLWSGPRPVRPFSAHFVPKPQGTQCPRKVGAALWLECSSQPRGEGEPEALGRGSVLPWAVPGGRLCARHTALDQADW